MDHVPSGATPASAVRAVLSLPFVFSVVVPGALVAGDPWRAATSWWGTIVIVAGVGLVGRIVADFYSIGRGTLAPWDPPRSLVTVGLFAFTRNPMYIGVLLVVGGWAVTFRSVLVAAYAVVLAIVFHLRVVRYEEPWAERTFGEEWIEYRRSVHRWLPRRPGE